MAIRGRTIRTIGARSDCSGMSLSRLPPGARIMTSTSRRPPVKPKHVSQSADKALSQYLLRNEASPSSAIVDSSAEPGYRPFSLNQHHGAHRKDTLKKWLTKLVRLYRWRHRKNACPASFKDRVMQRHYQGIIAAHSTSPTTSLRAIQ